MATKMFYIAIMMRKFHLAVIANIIDYLIRILFGCEIHSQMLCGEGLVLAHNGCGVVINKDTIIGNGVTIFQNVTIGGRKGSGAPVIGDRVMVGAGAVILGDVTIGDNAQIGANAVVIKDVPKNGTAVGVPAKIITNG